MTRRTPTAVHSMTDGEWLVRGVDDPMTALAMVVGELDDISDGIDVYAVQPNDDGDPIPEAVAQAAAWCHGMLAHARVGYYRILPCAPNSYGADEGWSWQIGYASGPGRGVFRGVYFRGY